MRKGNFERTRPSWNSNYTAESHQPLSNVPAVLHQVEDNLVQHLLKEGRPDPEVLHSLRGQAGQAGHLAVAVLALQALTPSAEGESRKCELSITCFKDSIE